MLVLKLYFYLLVVELVILVSFTVLDDFKMIALATPIRKMNF